MKKLKKAPNTPTPHNGAKNGDIAPLVLISGDPTRTEWVAKTFLKNVVCVTTVRGMLGFTGTWNGTQVTIMTSGMGQPSFGIMLYELINFYGVKRIIRIGSAGSLQPHIKKMDIVAAMSASTDSGMNNSRFPFCHFAPTCDPSLLRKVEDVAKRDNIKVYIGGIFAGDKFYPDMDPKSLELNWDSWKIFAKYGVLAVEMETAEFYTIAALYGVQALTLLTISDTLAKKSKRLSSEQRANAFGDMVRIALKTIVD